MAAIPASLIFLVIVGVICAGIGAGSLVRSLAASPAKRRRASSGRASFRFVRGATAP